MLFSTSVRESQLPEAQSLGASGSARYMWGWVEKGAEGQSREDFQAVLKSLLMDEGYSQRLGFRDPGQLHRGGSIETLAEDSDGNNAGIYWCLGFGASAKRTWLPGPRGRGSTRQKQGAGT